MSKNTIGYIIILALLALTNIFSLNLFLRQRSQHDALDIHTFPAKIGEWAAKDLPITEKEYRILETRNLIMREYTNPPGNKIVLFVIYSETNRSVFHPPEVCMIGSGIEIADKQPELLNFGKRSFSVSKLVIEKKNYKEIALYCYKVGNFYTDNYYLQQAHFALSQLFGKRTQGATIRAAMQVKGDEKETLTKLKAFMSDTIKIIEAL